MMFPSRDIVNRVREEYPAGTRVELIKMDDFQAPPIGTKGTVTGVDDTASIMVAWDNGSSLHVIYKKYLGTAFYPKIVDEELFNKAAEEKERRAVRLKRTDRIKVVEKAPVEYAFTMAKPKDKHDDPFMQAAYLYSLIRNEVNSNGSK